MAVTPPIDPDDERLIDDLMAKRAAGLRVTRMGEAEALAPLTAKQISWACDKHNARDPLERYYFCSGLREGYAMRPAPSATDAEPVRGGGGR